MQDSKSPVHPNPETESNDASHFDKSLQELRDLRSQLHNAAVYCETTFLNAKQKQEVVENTKEYICRAVVTVVDHLGSVSANLNYHLSKTNAVSDTELRINCLNQKLMTCQQYSHKLALRKLCWNADFLRHHPRYISPPIPDLHRSKEVLRESGSPIAAKAINKHKFETKETVPLLSYKHNYKPSLVEDSTMDIGVEKTQKRGNCSTPVLPIRNGLFLMPKSPRPLFHFQENRKLKRNMLNWKSLQNKGILSLIRKSK